MHPFCHTLHGLLQVSRVVSDHGAADHGFLPFVIQIHFRYRDIELAPQTRHQRLDSAALFFERGTAGQMEVDGEGGEHIIIEKLICLVLVPLGLLQVLIRPSQRRLPLVLWPCASTKGILLAECTTNHLSKPIIPQ